MTHLEPLASHEGQMENSPSHVPTIEDVWDSFRWEQTTFSNAYKALCAVHGSGAHFKSRVQAELIDAVLQRSTDVLCIMATGGGKSVAWETVGLMESDCRNAVVVELKKLLKQHLKKAINLGIPSMKFLAEHGPNVPFGVCC